MLLDLLRFFMVPLLLLSPILILAVVGMIWSPAAGAITAWLAHREGMPVFKAFGGGTAASIALFLPWCFLIANFLGWRSSNRLTEISYGLIIIVWFICPLALFTVSYGIFVAVTIILSSYADRGDMMALSLFFALFGGVAVLIEFVMWNNARRWVSGPREWNDIYLPGRVTALPRRHFWPFMGALLWSILAPTLLASSIYVWVTGA